MQDPTSTASAAGIIDTRIAIADVEPHPANYNRHPRQQLEKIAASLRTFGQVRPIVVWRRYIIAGHGVTEAARAEGWTHLAARRLPDDYPEHLALAYVAADNELSRQADPDAAALAALITSAIETDRAVLQAIGYDDAEYDRLLADVGAAAEAGDLNDQPGPTADHRAAAAEKWQTEIGQVWSIGPHRLLIGDSTDPANVARVMAGAAVQQMIADPPYGVDYSGKNAMLNAYGRGNRIQIDIENDDIGEGDPDAYRAFFAAFLKAPRYAKRNTVYIFMFGSMLHSLRAAFDDAGITWSDYLIWVKDGQVLSRKDYQARHEFIAYGWKDLHEFFGLYPATVIDGEPDPRKMTKDALIAYVRQLQNERNSTIIRIDKPRANVLHPTQKPIPLIEKLIKDGSQAGAALLDPFAGSGTTMIAAHNLARRAHLIEIDPSYGAIILERAAQEIGIVGKQETRSNGR